MKQNKSKKILGAVIATLICSLFFLFFIILFTYMQVTLDDKLPIFLFIFLIVIFTLPILGMIYNLVVRIKEIKGGEEDEASKY